MPAALPLFPLSTVLLPGASLPLHIFEPRYRQLVADLVSGTVPDRSFGVVAIKQGHEVGPGAVAAMHEIGCTARLREARRLPDGRYNIVIVGERRFGLGDVNEVAAPYLTGTVEWLPDTTPSQELRDLLPLLDGAARQAHQRYHAALGRSAEPPDQTVEPAELAHLVAADCQLAPADLQALLELRCPAERLWFIRKVLSIEAEFLRRLHAVPMPISQFAGETGSN